MRRLFVQSVLLLLCAVYGVVLVGCRASDAPSLSGSQPDQTVETAASSGGQIYLYGEIHANALFQQKELELWQGYYAEGMRHLFVELPSYEAAYLNLWMQAEDDTILEELYRDWTGTLSHSQTTLDFYRSIKQTCPETIFHGTDVGHQYNTAGRRYLTLLIHNGQKDSAEYQLTLQTIEQGKIYYQTRDDDYRENQMVDNFVQAFDALGGESIMGIYGANHLNRDGSGTVPTMAAQLAEQYPDTLHTTGIAQLYAEHPVLETLTIQGKHYTASYWGKEEISVSNYVAREFWRLEEGDDDFADCPTVNEVLPYSNYPVEVEPGQVFVLDLTTADGTVTRALYRADGVLWNGMPSSVRLDVPGITG